MSDSEVTFYDAFNARFLDPEVVAKSFVPSEHFDQLCGNSHSLLVGPRGSGKTTLLKMLQPSALGSWRHSRANHYRKVVDFTGIFVPADINWGAQLESLGYGELSPQHHRTLSIAAFTTHVLFAFLDVLVDRSVRERGSRAKYKGIKLSSGVEAALVLSLSEAWRAKPEIPSLSSLRHAMSKRLMEISIVANKLIHMPEDERGSALASHEYLHIDVVRAVSFGAAEVNTATDDPSRKWALLFDELEIAPQWIQDQLVRALRSVDQRLRIKLAISPVSTCARLLMQDELAPAGREDFREVCLWFPEKRRGYGFCRGLWKSLATSHDLPTLDPLHALGPSYFDPEGVKSGADPYRLDGPWDQRFKSLATKDESFRLYMSKVDVDPTRIPETTVSERNRIVRKVAPLVALRDFYRTPDASSRDLRSRKVDTVYAGAESVFAISEANPRWFIGIAGKLIKEIELPSTRIPQAAQANEIASAAERFLAMLQTILIPSRAVHDGMNPLVSLLRRIGEYFYIRAVLDDFHPDPALCFVIDSDISDETVQLLEIALNRGAIVYVPDEGGPVALKSIRGFRFRLCYLLAARFRLPLRIGKDIDLSRALSGGAKPTYDLFGSAL